MLNVFNNIASHDLVGYAIGVSGIILAIFFFKKGRKKTELSYSINSLPLISEAFGKWKDIDIAYMGSSIESLAITRIAIWNSGTETINSIDIARNDLLKICLRRSNVFLTEKFIVVNDRSNGINLKRMSDSALVVEFDFLDKKQGAVLQFFHTKNVDPVIDIKGTLKNSGNIKKIKTRPTLFNGAFFNYFTIIFLFIIGILEFFKTPPYPRPDWAIVFNIAKTLSAWGIGLFFYLRYVRALMPKKLLLHYPFRYDNEAEIQVQSDNWPPIK